MRTFLLHAACATYAAVAADPSYVIAIVQSAMQMLRHIMNYRPRASKLGR